MNEDQIKCITSTIAHIHRVRELMLILINDLLHRSQIHDESKLRDPELSIFAKYQDALAITPYGTPAYNELKEKVKEAIDHHYSKNRHHHEHHKNGVNDMTLLDLIEMLSDWIASSERNQNGNIRHSLEINSNRFGFSDQLIKIFENTIKEMNFQPKG